MTGGSSPDEPVAADEGIAEAGGDVAASSMLQTASLLLVATRTSRSSGTVAKLPLQLLAGYPR